jgi:hypothetical protein
MNDERRWVMRIHFRSTVDQVDHAAVEAYCMPGGGDAGEYKG